MSHAAHDLYHAYGLNPGYRNTQGHSAASKATHSTLELTPPAAPQPLTLVPDAQAERALPTAESRAQDAPSYEALAARFRPLFARIAAGALERERYRNLPYEAVDWLKKAGFGAVRIPIAHGGAGASLPQLIHLLIELAEADANVAQIFRGHFAFVEEQLNRPADATRARWFRRFVYGDLVGHAWTEAGDAKLDESNTKLSAEANYWTLTGIKHYSTGAIFADWIDVYAQFSDTGAPVAVAVSTHQAGVERKDDWNGFGQRTSGSGSTIFHNARVEAEHVTDFSRRFPYQTAFYQLVLIAAQTGSAKAAVKEATQALRERQRAFSHGNATRPAEDVQILEVIGRLSAQTYAAEAVALKAAEAAQVAHESHLAGDAEIAQQANIAAEVESAAAQIVISQLALSVASELFDALGASAAGPDRLLDRHWRNIRTLASHNPQIYKARILGNWVVNGTEPPGFWRVGIGKAKT
jgi:alkylation response protein AidB-like acyl-CoA dehydrogenase